MDMASGSALLLSAVTATLVPVPYWFREEGGSGRIRCDGLGSGVWGKSGETGKKKRKKLVRKEKSGDGIKRGASLAHPRARGAGREKTSLHWSKCSRSSKRAHYGIVVFGGNRKESTKVISHVSHLAFCVCWRLWNKVRMDTGTCFPRCNAPLLWVNLLFGRVNPCKNKNKERKHQKCFLWNYRDRRDASRVHCCTLAEMSRR